MKIRDAVEADAERMANLTGSPTDVMRNLVHDRTVRVATPDADAGADADADTDADADADAEGGELEGFVSFDAQDETVHVTQLEGDPELGEKLLEEPRRFADREGMTVELLVPEDDENAQAAAERASFDEHGPGPRFDGTQTTRYRWRPND